MGKFLSEQSITPLLTGLNTRVSFILSKFGFVDGGPGINCLSFPSKNDFYNKSYALVMLTVCNSGRYIPCRLLIETP